MDKGTSVSELHAIYWCGHFWDNGLSYHWTKFYFGDDVPVFGSLKTKINKILLYSDHIFKPFTNWKKKTMVVALHQEEL